MPQDTVLIGIKNQTTQPIPSNESQYHGTPLHPHWENRSGKPDPRRWIFSSGNPILAGMRQRMGKVVLNPFTSLSPSELGAVAKNEAVRQWLRNMDTPPDVRLTGAQQQTFAGYSEGTQGIFRTRYWHE